jgi:biotin carboxylase
MRSLTIIPDAATIAGLIKDLLSVLTGQAPHAMHDAIPLQSIGLDQRRLMFALGGIQQSFGVLIPSSVIGDAIHTVGQFADVTANAVHQALSTRIPIRETPSNGRLLIVGGAGAADFEQAAARRGWRASVLTYYDAGQGSGLRVGALGVIDHVEAADWARPLDVVRRIVELYKIGEIDAVVAIDEFGLLPAALATTQLGIPGLSLKAVRNTRDKFEMRRVLEAAGLAQVRYALCANVNDALAFLDRAGGPIIAKPVSGTGSEGVSLIASADALASAFELASSAAGFSGILCEEYIDGPEVSLEGYSVDGRFVPVALTDKLVNERFLEIGHQQPSRHSQDVFDSAAAVTAQALAALGITDGVTHTELRISRTRGPVIIETHTRMGGGSIHVLTQLTTGVSLPDLMVAFSLGEHVDAQAAPQGRAAAIRFLLGQPGQVRGVRMQPADADRGIHTVLGPPIGKVVSGRSASRDRLGYVIATGATAQDAAMAAEDCVRSFRIEYVDQPAGQSAARAVAAAAV